jgi:hypothetical protein
MAQHPLLDLLDLGAIPESRVSTASAALIGALVQTGAITRDKVGRSWHLKLHNPPALRAVLETHQAGLLAPADPALPPKTRAIANGRDAHGAPCGDAEAILVKAPVGMWMQGPYGQRLDVGELTAVAGMAAFLLTDAGGWTFHSDRPVNLVLATVENAEDFIHAEAIGIPADAWIATQGRLSNRALGWLATLAVAGGSLIHLGDYDPVGLDEYLRLRRAWGARVRLHTPPDLEVRFRKANPKILDRPRNQELLAKLIRGEASLPADARRVLGLIRAHGAGLEMEWLRMPMPPG